MPAVSTSTAESPQPPLPPGRGTHEARGGASSLRIAARLVATLVVTGIFGAALDQLHVQSGTLSYAQPGPGIDGQPWWVGPQFGIAITGLLLAAAFLTVGPRAGTKRTRARTLAFDTAWFIGVYVASALAHHHAYLAAGLFAGVVIARLTRMQSSAELRLSASAIVFISIFAIGGVGYEQLLTSAGAFSYTSPTLGNVPIWLPMLYFTGAITAIDSAAGFRRWLVSAPAPALIGEAPTSRR
ncbi:MAG: DUF2878 family protein [Thermoleophilia bacterium]|nr:DUF2878 family protein [Thermoleophilia bacterium]